MSAQAFGGARGTGVLGSLSAMLALAGVAPPPAMAQAPRIVSETEVAADSSAQLLEAHLAIAPADPKHLVAAAMAARAAGGVTDCLVVASFDGGRRWRRHDLGLRDCADPWVLVTGSGAVLVSVLSGRGISVYRSADGGRTWPAVPLRIEGAHDHPMMTRTSTGDTVYLVSGLATRGQLGQGRSAVFVAVSTDGGRTFRPVQQALASNLSYEAMTPVVSSTGALVVPIQDHHRASGERLRMRRSWLLVFPGPTGRPDVPRLIDEGCNRRGPVGWPVLALSDSDRHAERLVWACEAEEGRGILTRSSDDLGETWSEPARLAAGDSSAWTKVPALAVDRDGVTLATWFESGPPPRSTCLGLRAAVSRDGGVSFGAPVTVSRGGTCRMDGDVWARFPAGGDYIGLASSEAGAFLALWSDARTGSFRLYLATIRVADR